MALRLCRAVFLLCALLPIKSLAWAGPSSTVVTGRVVGPQGAPVSGAVVTLMGSSGIASTRTGADGSFLVRDLPEGNYLFKMDHPGFLMLLQAIRVSAGATVHVEARAAAMLAPPTVTASVPLADARSTTTGENFSRETLARLPLSRSYTDLIRAVPGVSTDQQDIGGSAAGNPMSVQRNGSSHEQNIYRVDGVNISDMSTPGDTPAFFIGTDAIRDMRVSTGGVGNVFGQASGATVDIVTRSGTNRISGSASGYWTGGPLVTDFKEPGFNQLSGTTLSSSQDYGFNLGGPIVKDRLWFYGGFNRQDVARTAGSGGVQVDNGFATNDFQLKLNAQIGLHDRLNVSTMLSPYTLEGFGASPDLGLGSVWSKEGTPGLFSFEDRHMCNPHFVIDGGYSRVNLNYTLTPAGGADAVTIVDPFGVYQNSNFLQDTKRHADEWKVNATYNVRLGGMGHDISFGYDHRTFDDDTSRTLPGGQVVFQGSQDIALLAPGLTSSNGTMYSSFHVQDFLRFTKFTATLGVEQKYQTGQPYASTVIANPLHPTSIPGATYPGGEAMLKWNNWEPHLGLAYSLDKKTTLRASYAKYTDQLTIPNAAFLNPTAGPLGPGGELFSFTSRDGSGFYKNGDPMGPVQIVGGIPTGDSRFLVSPSYVPPGVDAPVTREFNVDFRHRFHLGEFTFDYGKRHRQDILSQTDLVSATQLATTDLYAPGSILTAIDPDGNVVTLKPYALQPSYEFTGGQIISNLLWQRELDAWDMVFGFHHKSRDCGYIDGWFGYDHSHWIVPATTFRDPNDLLGSSDNDGAVAADQSAGSNRSAYFLNSQWSYQISAFTPKARVVDLSGRFWGRQGYPAPLFGTVHGSDGQIREIQIGALDADRYPSLHVLDIRVSHSFLVSRASRLEVGADIFNVTNSQTVLQQNLDVFPTLPTQKGLIVERLNPRVVQVGIKLTF